MSKKTNGQKLLAEWSKRLGLSGWKIQLYDNCIPDEMEISDSSGCASYVESNKMARIRIVNPCLMLNAFDEYFTFDYEKTLVHELLHLKFSLVADNVGDLQGRIMHQLIDDMAKALVDAKRSGQKGD